MDFIKKLERGKARIKRYIQIFLTWNRPKIFCIGHNKTGTTSLSKALTDLGYVVGMQAEAEKMINFYKIRNFKPILSYCKYAQAFQDMPFSLPYLFVALDQSFPGSKFILTVRDSSDQWYDSLIKFQKKRFGNGNLPTKEDLINSTYRWKGFSYETKNIIYGTEDTDLYNRKKLVDLYERHNEAVIDYFRFRENDLLVLNLSERDSYLKLCKFLNKKPLYQEFPWRNRS